MVRLIIDSDGNETMEEIAEDTETASVDEKQLIIAQLNSLDEEMPRIREDMILFEMERGFQPHQKYLDIIAEKQQLREQLNQLNNT